MWYYTTQSGDTLSTIARTYLGQATKYMDIYNLNKDIIGADPNNIYEGMLLVMPDPPAGVTSTVKLPATTTKTTSAATPLYTQGATSSGIMDKIKSLFTNKYVMIASAGLLAFAALQMGLFGKKSGGGSSYTPSAPAKKMRKASKKRKKSSKKKTRKSSKRRRR